MRDRSKALLAYWLANARRGFGIAWGMVFSSPRRAATTLAVALLASLIAFAFTRDVELAKRLASSACYGFAAITVLAIAAGFGLTITWAPYVTWREIKAQVPAPTEGLPGGYKLTADTRLETALCWAATGLWAERPEYDDDQLVALQGAVAVFVNLAFVGHIHVWQKVYPDDDLWDRLEKGCWYTFRINAPDVANGTARLVRRDGTKAEKQIGHGLRVCREEWEKRWHLLKEREG